MKRTTTNKSFDFNKRKKMTPSEISDAVEKIKANKEYYTNLLLKKLNPMGTKQKTTSKAVTKQDKESLPAKKKTKEFKRSENELISAFNTSRDIQETGRIFYEMDEATKEMITSGKANDFLSYVALDDDGSQTFFKVVFPMRHQLIKEYDIRTKSEYMILDSAVMNYARFLTYQRRISYYTGINLCKDSSLILERLNRMSENALNQFNRGIEALRTVKLSPLPVKIFNSQVNVGNNQQILKTGDVPSLKEASETNQIISEVGNRSLPDRAKHKSIKEAKKIQE